jgi:hypothetical protein
MPTCSEAYGEGWVGTYPNCTYNPQGQTIRNMRINPDQYSKSVKDPFTGTVDSLGYGEELAGSTHEDDWQKFFDPYDPKGQELLESAWDLKGKQLGQTWGLKREELGAGAGAGYGQIREAGSKGYKKSGMAFSGTISEMERKKRGEVTGGYKRALGLGNTAYQQALEAGALQLESGIFGLEKDWEKDQRATLNMLLGSGIWPDDDTTSTTDTTPPGGGGVFNPYDPSDEIEDIADITTENPPEESCPTGCVQGYSGCVNIVTGQPC